MRQYNEVCLIERIIGTGSYLTAGWLGALWLIFASLLKKRVTPFVMYHSFQAIFLSILYFLLSAFAGFILAIIYRIPIINLIPNLFLMPIPLLFGFSLIQAFTTALILYLIITSALGKYSYIPWVSDIIKSSIGR